MAPDFDVDFFVGGFFAAVFLGAAAAVDADVLADLAAFFGADSFDVDEAFLLAGVLFSGVFLADVFLADVFFADVFFAGAFLADVFLADVFFAGAFLAGGFLDVDARF
ncbi:MAG: hypothetical protein HRT86_11750 [Ilumatobacteraceae bacterium]|nr:hypothetical protein [Ilumatobacteraceae bacterium]